MIRRWSLRGLPILLSKVKVRLTGEDLKKKNVFTKDAVGNYQWAASRENRPTTSCDNFERSWVKVRQSYTQPMYFVTSKCHIWAISKDFLVLFSSGSKLAKGEYFHRKISKSFFFWHKVSILKRQLKCTWFSNSQYCKSRMISYAFFFV